MSGAGVQRFVILRVIVTTNDYTLAANVGGPHELSLRTFDVLAPSDLVAFLDEAKALQYTARWISGVEVREA
jgi:hypothetical protein